LTAYRRGDVVLVAMDFTDRSGSKLRPALVVSGEGYNRGTPDVLIASITGNLKAIPHPGDHRIREWKGAGLLKPSLAQTKLATVENSIVRRRLGRLHPHDLTAFSRGLKEALGLADEQDE
jgi:mRNA interferase MazF